MTSSGYTWFFPVFEPSALTATAGGGRDSLVLVLGALQMCVILGHRVERDAADFTAVAPFQTWKPAETNMKTTITGYK